MPQLKTPSSSEVAAMIEGVLRHCTEMEAALAYKDSPASARPRIFDGTAEAKLIALACSKPPAGRARWTLQLLEEKVVGLSIVERASDNTIGRTLKKTISNPTCRSNGLSRRTAAPHS